MMLAEADEPTQVGLSARSGGSSAAGQKPTTAPPPADPALQREGTRLLRELQVTTMAGTLLTTAFHAAHVSESAHVSHADGAHHVEAHDVEYQLSSKSKAAHTDYWKQASVEVNSEEQWVQRLALRFAPDVRIWLERFWQAALATEHVKREHEVSKARKRLKRGSHVALATVALARRASSSRSEREADGEGGDGDAEAQGQGEEEEEPLTSCTKRMYAALYRRVYALLVEEWDGAHGADGKERLRAPTREERALREHRDRVRGAAAALAAAGGAANGGGDDSDSDEGDDEADCEATIAEDWEHDSLPPHEEMSREAFEDSLFELTDGM
jgi:hypothetical protein